MKEDEKKREYEAVSISTLAILCLLLYAYTQYSVVDNNPDSPLSPLPSPTEELIYYPYTGGYLEDIQATTNLEMILGDPDADVYQLSHDPRAYIVAPHDPDYDPTSGMEYVQDICDPDTITWYQMPPATELVIDADGDKGILFDEQIEAVEILCKNDN